MRRLWVIDAETGRKELLLEEEAASPSFQPHQTFHPHLCWSPDGMIIACELEDAVVPGRLHIGFARLEGRK